MCHIMYQNDLRNISQQNIYLLKVNNRSTRKRCQICWASTTKTPERCHCLRSGIPRTFFQCFCYVQTRKRLLGLFWNFLLIFSPCTFSDVFTLLQEGTKLKIMTKIPSTHFYKGSRFFWTWDPESKSGGES